MATIASHAAGQGPDLTTSPPLIPAAAVSGDPETIAKIKQFTQEIFGSEPSMEESFDPEYGGDPYIVFGVETCGTIEELLAKERDWIRRLIEVAPGWNPYTLSLRPRDEGE